MNLDVADTVLPKEFDFYGQGQLVWDRTPQAKNEPEYTNAIGFQIHELQNLQGLMIAFFFTDGIDPDAALEMGNLLAGRLTTELDRKKIISESQISPPHVIRGELGFYAMLLAPHWFEAHYRYNTEGKSYPILMRLIPTPVEIANA